MSDTAERTIEFIEELQQKNAEQKYEIQELKIEILELKQEIIANLTFQTMPELSGTRAI